MHIRDLIVELQHGDQAPVTMQSTRLDTSMPTTDLSSHQKAHTTSKLQMPTRTSIGLLSCKSLLQASRKVHHAPSVFQSLWRLAWQNAATSFVYPASLGL